MAEVERRRADAPAASQAAVDMENLPALLGRLGDDVMRLVDTKLSLVKVELKEDASFYARNGAFTAVGAMVALIGFALLNVAVAFFISNLLVLCHDCVLDLRYGLRDGFARLLHATLKFGLRRVNVGVCGLGHALEPYTSFFSHCLSFLISSRVVVGTGLYAASLFFITSTITPPMTM